MKNIPFKKLHFPKSFSVLYFLEFFTCGIKSDDIRDTYALVFQNKVNDFIGHIHYRSHRGKNALINE